MKQMKVGYTTMTHGLKGEVKFFPSVSFSDKFLKKDFPIYIHDTKHTISSVRPHKNMYLLTLDNLNDINLVENFRNQDIWIQLEDLHLPKDEILVECLLHFSVFWKEKKIGIVSEILYQKNNTLLRVKGEKNILIPYQKEFIETILFEEEKIYCKNIEDFFSLTQ